MKADKSETNVTAYAPGPTPLEIWSRDVRRGGKSQPDAVAQDLGWVREVSQPVETFPQPQTQTQHQPSQADDFVLAHFAIFGCLPDQGARLYWQQRGDKKMEFTSLVEKFLDVVDHNPSEVWDKIGIPQILELSPAKWPDLGPLPFLVAAYQFLTGKLPKTEKVDELLKKLLGKSMTPSDVVSLISSAVNVEAGRVDVLLDHFTPSRRNQLQFWRNTGADHVAFDDKDIFHSIVQLGLVRELSRTNWGMQPYQAMRRMTALSR